ncbi:YxcD family protein [Brevibacillus composti]|uniref:YxcD family protein n=1 Tax=Brevibacillus composti TaxID=2796470 RepID=A0A7T5EKK1_9BACL|nr:YxcD family protein [Brevibacillus composti]QQE74334.1 YxcD family protein [Brevibacillus composti]QUO41416.1 YxcD family protein [Brevibacillus composti]
MEKIKILEQDIINAVCLHVASKKQIKPEEVMVELMWDEEYGFSAEVEANGRQQIFVEINLIEAIRYWLQHYMNRDPFAARLELVLDDEEGIIAYASYGS